MFARSPHRRRDPADLGIKQDGRRGGGQHHRQHHQPPHGDKCCQRRFHRVHRHAAQQDTPKEPREQDDALATIARSRRRTVAVRSAADDPVAGQVQVGELSVLAVDLELHRAARRPARGAANVGDLIFEAGRQDDLGPRFLAADFVSDRLANHLDIAGNRHAPAAAIDIDFEIYRVNTGSCILVTVEA